MSLTVLIGGARSGKSSLAVDWGERCGGPVTYVATAPAQRDHRGTDDHDADLDDRITRHQAERPSSWTTIEEPIDLAGALGRADGDRVIVDCLTLWTSNLMWHGHDDEAIDALATDAATRAAKYGRPVLAITNEVGLGVHPTSELGRRYRDVLGRVNQRWIGAAAQSLLLVGGRAVELRDPWELLPDSGDAG